jgi:hypothetical protein
MLQATRQTLFVAAAAMMFGGAAMAAGHQDEFFKAIGSGKADAATKLMHPALVEEVDEPVLGAWIDAINEKLGPVTEIRQTGISQEASLTQRKIETTAAVQFERGSANSSLTTLNGKIVAFNVESEQLGDWFRGPKGIGVYQQRGKAFIVRFFNGEIDDAHAMFHDELKKAVSKEDLARMSEQVRANAGALKSATFKDSRYSADENTQTLLVNFDIACENATGVCEIKIQFVGMKGHLLGFNFQ